MTKLTAPTTTFEHLVDTQLGEVLRYDTTPDNEYIKIGRARMALATLVRRGASSTMLRQVLLDAVIVNAAHHSDGSPSIFTKTGNPS